MPLSELREYARAAEIEKGDYYLYRKPERKNFVPEGYKGQIRKERQPENMLAL